MVREVLDLLAPRPGGRYLDCTVGMGGHAEAILQASAPSGHLYGIDRDPEAVLSAQRRLHAYAGRVDLLPGDFRRVRILCHDKGWGPFDGILCDLGVSSAQLEDPERGFSFAHEGPLDMRMDRRGGGITAAALLARLSEKELADLFWRYGEERWSRRIARRIVEERRREPIHSTQHLAKLIAAAIPRKAWPKRIHPATRVFQALRIAVNEELTGLGEAVQEAVELLTPGGRLCVISFHSLEDRVIKTVFRELAGEDPPRVHIMLTKKPLTPSADERHTNPRSRSAKLRAVAR